MYSGWTAGTNFIRERYLVTTEERAAWKAIISRVEVASLQRIQVSGRCSIFSSFLFSLLLFVPQLDVVLMVMEKSLQRLSKSECYSEEEKKWMSQPFWFPQQVYPWQIFTSGIQLIPFPLYGRLARLFCLDSIYHADQKWDSARRLRHLKIGVCFEVSTCL